MALDSILNKSSPLCVLVPQLKSGRLAKLVFQLVALLAELAELLYQVVDLSSAGLQVALLSDDLSRRLSSYLALFGLAFTLALALAFGM